mmetsp:Transcript_70595/g.169140  ORF Transcript_70595/g.169140 Transcript_70595/m.169140 type:complete len:505 (+) Transcript_70595:86-1600(+)
MGEASVEDFSQAAGAVAIGPIFLLLAWCVALARRKSKASPAEQSAVHHPSAVPERRERVLYFDAWRVLCVACVVVTHANESYADWNIAAVQQWVLQVIIVISGTLYGMSRASLAHLLHYESRLFAIFSFGVALNWLGLVIADEAWWTNVAGKVYFQMAFIGLMIVGALVSFPLKHFLDEYSTAAELKAFACYGACTTASAACWIYFVGVSNRDDLEVTLRAMTLTLGMLLTAQLLLSTLPVRHRGVTGWLLLAWLYIASVATRNPRVGYWCHLIDIYNWALVVQRVPLTGSGCVGFFLVQTWPFWGVIGGLLGIFPGVNGRKDKFPFHDLADRAQYYPLELLFILAFVTIPTAGRERTVPLAEAWREHLPWLNLWSLLAFCTHQALYYVIGGRPWGLAIMTLSPGAVFAVWHSASLAARRSSHKKKPVAGGKGVATTEVESPYTSTTADPEKVDYNQCTNGHVNYDTGVRSPVVIGCSDGNTTTQDPCVPSAAPPDGLQSEQEP